MILNHSGILSQIANAFWDWFYNFNYNWDGGTFTINDYFIWCCVVFVIAFFICKILFVWLPNRMEDGFLDDMFGDL